MHLLYIHEDLISDTGAGRRQGNTSPDRYNLSLIPTPSLHKRSTFELYIHNSYIVLNSDTYIVFNILIQE